jgi:putative FmdB family regulatory protein
MPIYEFLCDKCRRRSSVLTMRISEKVAPVCEHCGSKKMRRLMSRFAMPKSEEARLDALSDPSNLSGFDENDPKSVARMMRKMGKEMGEDFSAPEFDEAIDELEQGGGLDDDDAGDGSDDDL